MKTLILTRHDVEKILTPTVANQTVEKAFRAYSLGCTQMPPKSYLYFPKGDLRSMPAYISGEGFNIAGSNASLFIRKMQQVKCLVSWLSLF